MDSIGNFGVKDLYEVVIKAASPMAFGDWTLEVGEPILILKNSLISLLEQKAKIVAAKGGRGNISQIIWESKDDLTFACESGILNPIGLRFLMGSNMAVNPQTAQTPVYKIEEITLDAVGKGILAHEPVGTKPVFVFAFSDDNRQSKVEFSRVAEVIDCGTWGVNKNVIVSYYYNYGDEALVYTIDKAGFKGVFSLDGKFYTVDEKSGMRSTNLLYIPRVKIVSNLSFRLGERVDPLMSSFHFIGMAASENGEEFVAKVTQLKEDIDADI